MFEFLSYGGGVNSSAVVVLLQPSHLIFADTGDEHPTTYQYIETIIKPYVMNYGGSFVTVRNEGKYQSLYEQSIAEHIIPVRVNRWCTDKWKIRPIHRYLKEHKLLPCHQIIAFDAGESHRAKPSGNNQIENVFPLIDRNIDREDCISLLRAAGLEIPRKSGCFYCPFQSKPNWIALKKEYPKLFDRAAMMERNVQNYGTFFLAADVPLEEYITSGRIVYDENQLEMALPCACYDG